MTYSKETRGLTGLIILLLLVSFFLTNCNARFNALVKDKAEGFAAATIDEGFDEAEDQTEDAVEAGVENTANNLIQGPKKINVDYTRGCVDIVISRDNGLINGKRKVIVPAGKTEELRIRIPTFSSDRGEFQLLAERIGEIPPGCDEIQPISETFSTDHDIDDWNISLR